jgi:hypothetical protein
MPSQRAIRQPFRTFLRFFGTGVFSIDATTYDPLKILLNTQDREERDTLTRQWRDHKLSELNFIGVVVS